MFVGLLDGNRQEINGAGYHRIDISAIDFRITPANDGDPHDYVVINNTPVQWRAKGHWPDLHGVGIWDWPYGGKLLSSSKFPSVKQGIGPGIFVTIQRGMLQFSVKFDALVTAIMRS